MNKIKKMLSDIRVVVSIIIIVVAAYLFIKPFLSEMVIDTINSLSAVITIVTALFTYMAWRNTQKLIAERKMETIKVNKGDIILAISLTYQKTDIEKSIISSNLPELQSIISDGEPIYVEGSGKLIPTNKYIHLSKSSSINRGFVIRGSIMPFSKKDELYSYLSEFTTSISWLYDAISNSGCQNIHMFISSPVELSAYVMPYFVNKINVLAYHWDPKEQKYFYLGPVDNRDVLSR